MPEIQSWDSDELRAFVEYVEGSRLDASWLLTAMTGMRRGEGLGLRWSDVDLDASRRSVRQTLVTVGYDVITSTPKNHNARVIDLDTETVRKLRRRRRHKTPSVPRGAPTISTRVSVVAKENGEPIHPHTFSQSFERIIQQAGSPAFALEQCAHVLPGMQAEAARSVAALVARQTRGTLRELAGTAGRPSRMGTYVRVETYPNPTCALTTKDKCSPSGRLTCRP